MAPVGSLATRVVDIRAEGYRSERFRKGVSHARAVLPRASRRSTAVGRHRDTPELRKRGRAHRQLDKGRRARSAASEEADPPRSKPWQCDAQRVRAVLQSKTATEELELKVSDRELRCDHAVGVPRGQLEEANEIEGSSDSSEQPSEHRRPTAYRRYRRSRAGSAGALPSRAPAGQHRVASAPLLEGRDRSGRPRRRRQRRMIEAGDP